jgi:flagellar biosynthesis/type III secretory pathway M-ring protein FliF/YscJ
MHYVKAFFLCVGVICVLLFVIFIICRYLAHGSTDSGATGDIQSVGDSQQRAADDNRELKDAEQRATETIKQQAEDIRRAEELTQSIAGLIQKGKDILGGDNGNSERGSLGDRIGDREGK